MIDKNAQIEFFKDSVGLYSLIKIRNYKEFVARQIVYSSEKIYLNDGWLIRISYSESHLLKLL
jgi:hypothetical protein